MEGNPRRGLKRASVRSAALRQPRSSNGGQSPQGTETLIWAGRSHEPCCVQMEGNPRRGLKHQTTVNLANQNEVVQMEGNPRRGLKRLREFHPDGQELAVQMEGNPRRGLKRLPGQPRCVGREWRSNGGQSP